MARETRSEGTARVTCAVASWLWGLGSRCLVTEVGLSPNRGLGTPWQGRWRVDLAAVVPVYDGHYERFDVIEVKGSAADLRREDLGKGKWQICYQALGLTPWLAVADTVPEKDYDQLPGDWGLLTVKGTRVIVTRRPRDEIKHNVLSPTTTSFAVHRALSQTQCLQTMPMLMGLSGKGRAAAMFETLTRPWSAWLPSPSTVTCEEPGNIL